MPKPDAMKKKKAANKQAKRKTSENSKNEVPSEPYKLEDFQYALTELIKYRAYMSDFIDKNPLDFKARAVLIETDENIKSVKRHISRLLTAKMRETIVNIENELTETLDNTCDEDLVEFGIECNVAHHIRDYAGILDGFAKTAKNLHPDDEPQEILDEFSRVIIEARQKFKERRAAAEERLPHLRKVYEMDGNYQKALADLLEAIELRDQLVKEIKIAPPEKIREGQLLIQEMTKKIDESEEALAAEYEAFQTHARAVDALRDEAKSSTDEELRRLRLHFKENPDDMKELQKIIEEEFPEK